MIRNYVVVAILSIVFMCCTLLFAPFKGNKNRNLKGNQLGTDGFSENSSNNSSENKAFDESSDSVVRKLDSEISFDDSSKYGVFDSFDVRDIARAHRMEEKYFMGYSARQSHETSNNLEKKLKSISNADLQKERTKKGKDSDN